CCILQATCCREKSVLVAVYVERPRKKGLSSSKNNQQHHHHHHHHLHLHQAKLGANSGKGYNRRAELLNYSRRLRESARSAPASPQHPKPISSSNQQPITQMTTIRSKKQKHARTSPACLDNWKIMIPGFLRSQARKESKKKKEKSHDESASKKAKAIMKSFQVKKKGGFISKLLATIQKYR
ncbi:hypothetical protein RJ640_012949, partial [Escallonia rubra]